MSYQKFSINELTSIFGVNRKTIYNWLTKWEDQQKKESTIKKVGAENRGLNQSQKQQVKEWVKSEPKSLKKVQLKIDKEWKINVSKETIKRIIKKLEMKWKRMKLRMSKTQDNWELEVKIPRLEELKEQATKAEIDLRYLDERGFSLRPNIPYGWPERLEKITLNSCQSKRINVLGLMGSKNQLNYEIHHGVIDSEIVINFLDKFSQNLAKIRLCSYGSNFNPYK